MRKIANFWQMLRNLKKTTKMRWSILVNGTRIEKFFMHFRIKIFKSYVLSIRRVIPAKINTFKVLRKDEKVDKPKD